MIAMINKSVARIVVILLLIFLSVIEVKVADANPEGSIPNLSMPVEYINYTITNINGALWAKIDGDYPIYLLKQLNCNFNGDLPMVYPMPPQTTNISVSLDGKEVSWSNYTQSYPDALHHTAIGDWWMIYSNLENISDKFELRIHYEHPLEVINGSYIFLYDLNISPYLSSQSDNSTAFFRINMQTNFSSLKVYSTQTDAKWEPVNFALTKNGSVEVVLVEMFSEYGKPLAGDLVLEFSKDRQVSEFPLLTLIILSIGVLLATLFYKRKTGKIKSMTFSQANVYPHVYRFRLLKMTPKNNL